uniref:Globin family profile domain-containing protein n=1 Tax=Plectus sambesii TaxID=2011161 RepID=A0A914UTJ9_9BILA
MSIVKCITGSSCSIILDSTRPLTKVASASIGLLFPAISQTMMSTLSWLSTGSSGSPRGHQHKRRVSSPHSGKILELDADDMRRIRDCWSRTADKTACIELIFIRLFSHAQQEIAAHFRLAGLDADLLRAHPKFRAHVCKFMQFLTSIVDLLEKKEEEEFIELIRAVGRRHNTVRGMSFTAEKWLVFKNVMLAVICRTEDPHDKLYQSWNKFFMFVISEMKDAYFEGVRSNSWPEIEPVLGAEVDRKCSAPEECEIVGKLEL